MRGFVMVLMTIDHASLAFNGNRLSADSAGLYVVGISYSAAEFLTRWISHLCAPTFVLLAGTALALSTERRIAKGASEKEIDKNLIKRGAIIAALDPTLISLLKGHLTFQVLFAIGTSMMLMAVLRKLPSIWLFVLALGWILGGEAVTMLFWTPEHGWPGALSSVLFVTLYSADLQINYPIIPWLYASKYPPSLTFILLELGLLAICLAGFMLTEKHVTVRQNGPLLVFGQTALFFYLMHRIILDSSAALLGLHGFGGLSETFIISAAVLLVLYPACIWFRKYKQMHPHS